jgi:EAL and modified HD-GYP domain-containing signal transduction protein
VLLGPRALLGCVLAAGLSQDGGPCAPEAVEKVLVRARMCELLAATADGAGGERLDGSTAFTIGLISSLDTLLGASLREIVGELPVDEVVEHAVLYCAGAQGRVLSDVRAYEQQEPSQLLDVAGLRTLFVAALRWVAPLTLGSPG